MSIVTIGIDLAKNIFAVHGVNEHGKAELIKPKVARDQLLPLIASLPPCLIGMEACSGAHYWARQFHQYGHTVRLIAPNEQGRHSRWARNLLERRGYWRAAVAIAAKNARMAWAVLTYGEDFRFDLSEA